MDIVSAMEIVRDDPTTIRQQTQDGSTQAAINGVLLQVNPDNVLQARAALLTEVERFRNRIREIRQYGPQLIGRCGGDPISGAAQDLFNQKIQRYAVTPAMQYADELQRGADQLAEVARSFGIAEQRITDSFQPGANGPDPR